MGERGEMPGGTLRMYSKRELYADTPVTNEVGRRCYEALGFRQAYVVPEYYDEGLDGLTYLKLFAP
jgi:ribosomal protein S18 acetylase RimI-like enzyme